MVYRWKELDLFTIQTLSNIITFLQFALSPLELISSEAKVSDQNLITLLNTRLDSFVHFISAPLDLIRKYNNLIGPIRALLSAVLFNAIIIFLYAIFFLPSWRFLVFFLDIFIPCCFLFGIIFMWRKYETQKRISIIFIIIGTFYFLIRITLFVIQYFKHKKKKWHINLANRISSVFLSRLKKDHDFQDEVTDEILYEIDQDTIYIQFDEFHFPYKKRLIDFFTTFLIWLLLLLLIIFGFKKILKNSYNGQNLEDMSLVINMTIYAIFFGMSIRLIINVIWLIKPFERKVFKIFQFLHWIAYKGMYFLAGVSLIPLLGIALKASTTASHGCEYQYYFDTKSNADSFLSYFTKKESYCEKCTISSIESDPSCQKACSLDYDANAFFYNFVIDSSVYFSTFQELYFIPIFIFNLFYLSFFILGLRIIYKKAMEVLVILPAPTSSIECKFQTLINTLNSSPLSLFRSYRYENAFYSLSFSEAKLFIYFWTNFTFCGILPIPYIYDPIILCFIVSFASFFISESQFFSSPYISNLHNIVNFFSYLIAGVSSLFVGLHVSYLFVMPQQLSMFFLIIVIITPILTALVTPFFIKKDPLLVPTKFDLLKIERWDKKLNQLIDFRKQQMKAKKYKRKIFRSEDEENYIDDDDDDDKISVLEEPSVSISFYQNDKFQRDRNYSVNNFDLLKLAPIKVQEMLNNSKETEFKECIEKLWPKININDECFDKAAKEMIHSSNLLIDCIFYKNLIRLFNFFLIFSSACLGWCLASGIERWQRILYQRGSEYYLRCNMFQNGTFPSYGSY
ncbi:hypothetical protein M9Y10_026720 [Tritrichomonas musculus]|uniref:Uncharacterized protein n=1 Tax=Tritrichomonas musculus TaxID=1915356 RepID=A0ABR2H762_9EUKA